MFDDETITGDSPVPFGKYKGQPCSVLLADSGYREWVLTQAGIVEKYPAVIAFLCEGEQHSSTPAHNALQAKLLDPGFVDALGCSRGSFGLQLFQFEWNGFDAVLGVDGRLSVVVECKPTMSDDYPAVLRQVLVADQVAYAKRTTMLPANDSRRIYMPTHGLWVKVLLVGSFYSSVVTLDQAKRFFGLSRVELLTVAEVELAQLV